MSWMAKIFAKTYRSYSESQYLLIVSGMVILGILSLLGMSFVKSNSNKTLRALTWNMAAINNNPFEYWITNEDPAYNKLMMDVSEFIDKPGARDIAVSAVFTPVMFQALMSSMKKVGWSGLDEVEQRWNSEYKDRKIISGFIKDSAIGKKRLASMPDRVTNTITTADGSVVTRPTVINCYSEGDLGTMEKWWDLWIEFMFNKQVDIAKAGGVKSVKIYELLAPIKNSKYPSITKEEEKISIPLQTLCGAIFDAILVHMMNTLAPTSWQRLRSDICIKLNKQKNERSITILGKKYFLLPNIFRNSSLIGIPPFYLHFVSVQNLLMKRLISVSYRKYRQLSLKRPEAEKYQNYLMCTTLLVWTPIVTRILSSC